MAHIEASVDILVSKFKDSIFSSVASSPQSTDYDRISGSPVTGYADMLFDRIIRPCSKAGKGKKERSSNVAVG